MTSITFSKEDGKGQCRKEIHELFDAYQKEYLRLADIWEDVSLKSFIQAIETGSISCYFVTLDKCNTIECMITRNLVNKITHLTEEEKKQIASKWRKRKQISTLPIVLHDINTAKLNLKKIGSLKALGTKPSQYLEIDKRKHPYLQCCLSEKQVFDPKLFRNHNRCMIPFQDGYLTAIRYENRSLYFEQQEQQSLQCGVTKDTAIGHFSEAIHNYVVLQRTSTNDITNASALLSENTILLRLPKLKDMHPKIRASQVYEDPRIFTYDERLFLTATVLTDKHVRIALVELDPQTFVFKKGFVLGKDKELLEYASSSQKNWCLFINNKNEPCILTHAEPQFVVYQINLDTGELFNRSSVDSTLFFYEEIQSKLYIRCSSGMIRWTDKTLLTVLHTRDYDQEGIPPVYRSIFVEFEGRWPYAMVRKSSVKQFMKKNYRVEFVGGLCEKDENTLYVSLGIDDMRGEIIQVPKSSVFT